MPIAAADATAAGYSAAAKLAKSTKEADMLAAPKMARSADDVADSAKPHGDSGDVDVKDKSHRNSHFDENYKNEIYNYEALIGPSAEFIGDFDLYRPGVLSANHAETFVGYKYKTYKLIDDIVLFRAGSKDIPFGEYFSFEPPISEAQVRMDKSIKHQWESGVKSVVDYVYEIRIPKGT